MTEQLGRWRVGPQTEAFDEGQGKRAILRVVYDMLADVERQGARYDAIAARPRTRVCTATDLHGESSWSGHRWFSPATK
ncbi:hypothetical protein [Streptomyces sp. NPDC046862]|uniref:hypothetical protein n=1 Tax=Streptomyces sp. NPDC046862 TaxID=3154603 RepID=UPI0034535CAF